MNRHLIPGLMLACLLLWACQRDADGPASTPTPLPDRASIDWFEGSVDEAFALAREREQPLFLYWGAVWCPPCNQLRSTVFRDPAFVASTRAFIAVYLDGDSEGAQRWGEHFGAVGYPTLIVFGPQGEERTRLTSGMALERYPQALDAARRQGASLNTLLQQALSTPQALSLEQWAMLANTAWDADDGRLLGHTNPGQTLQTLAAQCPESAARHCRRLQLLGSIAKLDQPPDAQEIDNLMLILGTPALAQDNLSELQYYGVKLSAQTDEATQRVLREALRSLAETSFKDTSLPLKSRMLATRLHMDLQRDSEGELPQDDAALQKLVRSRAHWADQAASTPVERQALIYNAAWYLHQVGLSDEAVALLRAELERAVAPYYYMSYLADIEKARGNATLSLGWSARAWQLASGPATRTQWGVQHVFNLLELAADQHDTIETVINQLLDGVAQSRDGYYQRTRMRLQRLHTALARWSDQDPARAAPAQRLRQRILSLCAQSQTDCSSLAAET